MAKKKQIKVQKKLKRKVVQTDNLYVYKVSFSMICCFFLSTTTHTHESVVRGKSDKSNNPHTCIQHENFFFFFFSFFSCFEGGSDLRRGHTQKKLTIYVETLILLCKFM